MNYIIEYMTSYLSNHIENFSTSRLLIIDQLSYFYNYIKLLLMAKFTNNNNNNINRNNLYLKFNYKYNLVVFFKKRLIYTPKS